MESQLLSSFHHPPVERAGLQLKKEGYRPKFPVLLVPGTAHASI